ncbi:MAG: tRNA/rRNA methyltransferase [Bacteroidales bacterium]
MNISFVLVEPKVPENIGASARAIKTMGFNSLVLINPCDWKAGKSRFIAHGSADILGKARVYESLSEALTGSDLAVATSIRHRIVKMDIINARNLPEFLLSKSGCIHNVAIVFGREESGLTNDEIKLCDIISAIPLYSKYPSLNLAQAVMIYAYELSFLKSDFKKKIFLSEGNDESFAVLKNKVRQLLLKLGLNESDNRYGRIMERIVFLKNGDINLAHTLCNLINEKF